MHDFFFWASFITIVVVMAVMLGACAYQILLERKISAYMQDRIGPNRVGPYGLLQPIADGLKFLFKEDIIPAHVDKVLYLLAPAVALGTALLAFAVVPFGATTPPPMPPAPVAADAGPEAHRQFQERLATYEADQKEYRPSFQFVIAPGIDIGILWVFAVSSLTVYGVILGGWSANNKYSLLGGLRSSAQIISYEIPLGLSILGVLLLTGSLNLERIIDHQVKHGWNILYQPLAFLLFLVSVFAECNRLPFDLPEAEQELVGGYHTEYSALKFGMFFLGEYTHMITTSLLVSTLFLGGWQVLPFVPMPDGTPGVVLKLIVFLGKLVFFILLFMAIRWTIPRFRFDQLMGLAWKTLLPLALANLVCVMVVKELGWTPWLLLPLSLGLLLVTGWFGLRPSAPWPRRRIGEPVKMVAH